MRFQPSHCYVFATIFFCLGATSSFAILDFSRVTAFAEHCDDAVADSVFNSLVGEFREAILKGQHLDAFMVLNRLTYEPLKHRSEAIMVHLLWALPHITLNYGAQSHTLEVKIKAWLEKLQIQHAQEDPDSRKGLLSREAAVRASFLLDISNAKKLWENLIPLPNIQVAKIPMSREHLNKAYLLYANAHPTMKELVTPSETTWVPIDPITRDLGVALYVPPLDEEGHSSSHIFSKPNFTHDF